MIYRPVNILSHTECLALLCLCEARESETMWQHMKSSCVFPRLVFLFRINTQESLVGAKMKPEDKPGDPQ